MPFNADVDSTALYIYIIQLYRFLCHCSISNDNAAVDSASVTNTSDFSYRGRFLLFAQVTPAQRIHSYQMANDISIENQ